MVYLNYRNEHIWPLTRKWLHIFETFHLASLQFITFDHFESIHLILRLMPEIFYISIWWTNFWLLGIIHFQYKLFSLFPNQILVCATAFTAHYLFSFWDLTLVELVKQENKRVGRYIGTSLCKSQDQQNPWLIIHDKFEDLFTTITQGCQDFSQKDISAKRTS